jgi:hypothetical protein
MLTEAEKDTILKLLKAATHVTNTKGYNSIEEGLLNLNAKCNDPDAFTSIKGNFESALSEAAKLIGLTYSRVSRTRKGKKVKS